ncbi:hypothetical protein PROFUN_08870 [Planoprotostelium fungivorum]|uniref:Uncharacterized protein n=1 Tax=Planoprotostelium fungivorum TaxID=1890364 RepID=A0A2P6NIY9_9EUKA|nr:hypothetical protein PROFUN_08870 [Planoprotostelium fungivorum]
MPRNITTQRKNKRIDYYGFRSDAILEENTKNGRTSFECDRADSRQERAEANTPPSTTCINKTIRTARESEMGTQAVLGKDRTKRTEHDEADKFYCPPPSIGSYCTDNLCMYSLPVDSLYCGGQITKIVEGICPYVPQNYQSAVCKLWCLCLMGAVCGFYQLICSSLGYCPSDTTPGTTSSASLKSSNVEQCSICKKVHHAVNSSKIYPTRLDHLHKMALSHCAGSERCNSFVDNHIAQFATGLWSEQDPCAPSC